MRGIRFLSIFIAMLMLISSSNILMGNVESVRPVAGSTLYVGPTSTYKTIQSAVDAATSGDTIIVSNGTYNESVTIYKNNINLIGNSSTNCNISHYYDGGNWMTNYSAGINVTASGINITRFNITVGGNYTYGIRLNFSSSSNTNIINNNITTTGISSDGISLYLSSNNRIINNNIETFQQSSNGIHLRTNCRNNNITGNKIKTNDDQADGIYLYTASNNELMNNTIITSSNNSRGIYLSQCSKNNLMENKINTTLKAAHGILLIQSSNNELLGNTIDIWGEQGDGIQLGISDYNNLTGNIINIKNQTSEGISLDQANKNNISTNEIKITAINDHGIYLKKSSRNNIQDNTINTTESNVNGIHIYDSSSFNVVNNNHINTTDQVSNGIYLLEAWDNEFNNNDIITKEQMSYGFYLYNSSNNSMITNVIYTTGIRGDGFNITDSSGNNIVMDNTIETTRFNADGIYVSNGSENKLLNNNITIRGLAAHGILLYPDAINNIISDNEINCTGLYANGILLVKALNNELNYNIINTSSLALHGIHFKKASQNNLLNNEINTLSSNSYGIWLEDNSNGTVIIEGIIKTTGSGAFGVLIENSNKTHISNYHINTTGNGATAFNLSGVSATIVNSSIESTTDFDIYVTNDGNATAINCSYNDFDVTSNGGGVLQVQNYLHIEVYHEGGDTSIQNADVQIIDNGLPIYVSSGYGGSHSRTDSNGCLDNIIVTDRWYIYNNSPLENITNLKVKKIIDKFWEESRPDINMSTSHTEVFITSDIIAPPKPTGLTVTRVAGTNKLLVTWDLNLDTINYTVRIIWLGCEWTILGNVSHPNNWFVTDELIDNTLFTFTLEAWDKVNLSSGISSPVQYFLDDITPPQTPVNLRAEPVMGGDALKITWDKNSDDTMFYDIWWSEELTANWNPLVNLSFENDTYKFSDERLINGNTYYFKIRAWDKVELPSSFSAPFSVVHMDYIAPKAPDNLKTKSLSETQVNLTWSASPDPDVEGYLVFINKSDAGSGGPYKFMAIVNTLHYQFNELFENTKYYFTVQAFDEANNTSPFSQEVSDTTAAVPPLKPQLNPSPAYVNIPKLNITGNAEPTTLIVIYNNGLQVANGSTDETGEFKIEITLVEDSNEIKTQAIDSAMLTSGFSETQTVILDTEKPIADAGMDINITEAETIIFDASGSSDNYGIINYTWEFKNNIGNLIVSYGIELSYIFNDPGNYEVTLTVTDLAGNQAIDNLSVIVNEIIEPDRPTVDKTTPADGAIVVPLDIEVNITFSISMNTSSVENGLSITPEVDKSFKWTDNDTVLHIQFLRDLEYYTEYMITIGEVKGKTGGVLENTPYIFRFLTQDEIPARSITVTYPNEGIEIEPGDLVTVSGTSEGYMEGWLISVRIGDVYGQAPVASDGSWFVSIEVPENEGYYYIEVEGDGQKQMVKISVKEPEKSKDEEDIGLGLLEIIGLALIIIIIIIITFLVLVIRKKKAAKVEMGKDEEPIKPVGLEGRGELEEPKELKEPGHLGEPKASEEVKNVEKTAVQMGIPKATIQEGLVESKEPELVEPPPREQGKDELEDSDRYMCPLCKAVFTSLGDACPKCGVEFTKDVAYAQNSEAEE